MNETMIDDRPPGWPKDEDEDENDYRNTTVQYDASSMGNAQAI